MFYLEEAIMGNALFYFLLHVLTIQFFYIFKLIKYMIQIHARTDFFDI